MISKATLFAAWFSTAYAFSPTSINSRGFSIHATTENNANLFSSKTVDADKSNLFQSTTTSSTTTVAAVPKLAQRWRKSTKQLATLGPASSSFEMIEKLFLAGADIFRLNFSHGSQEQKLELLLIIRVSYL